MTQKPQRVEISYRTIVFTVLFLISLSLLWQLRSLLILFFFCFIFMEAINPAVVRLERYRLSRPLAIILLYLIILAVFSFAVAGVIPILVEQTSSLIAAFPDIIKNTTFLGASAIDISSQFKIIESLPANIAKTAVSLFSNIFSTFVIFVITFYLLIERKNFGHYGQFLFGVTGRDKTNKMLSLLELRLGSWVSAEILLMSIIGALAYLGYAILGLNYSVPLAIIAGLLEIVPNIGPTVATILAALVGLTISPLTALLAVIWGVIIQQLENNFIVPKIMRETVGLNPLITILLIAAGAKLGGVLGAVLAIPTYITFETLFRVFSDKTKLKETDKPNSV